MKRKIFSIVLASIMCLSVVLQPIQTQAEEIPTNPEVISDGYTESIVDEFGNTIKLEYIINEEEFKVNTYIDGKLIDYSVRKMEKDGEYSDTIIYNQLLEVKQSKSEGTVFIKRNVKETYNVNDLVKLQPSPVEDSLLNPLDPSPSSDEVSLLNTTKPISDEDSLLNPLVPSDEISISNITLPRPYAAYWTKCNSTLNTCGTLYKKTKVDQIQKFMFDFKKDIAISVIASTITMMWGIAIVSVLTLLGGLGIGVYNAFSTTALNGYYNATRTLYSYYVKVGTKETFKHNQAKYVVTWYNTKNAKKYNRTQHSASWVSEEGILNIGIIAGS